MERLIRQMGLQGAVRGKTSTRTTLAGTEERPADLGERQLRAPAPNGLWVADLTYVKTHAGRVYVAFVIDVFSRHVVALAPNIRPRKTLGWKTPAEAIGELLLSAWHNSVATTIEPGRYLSIRYTERLAQTGAVGSRGDSYDNALAESFHGLLQD